MAAVLNVGGKEFNVEDEWILKKTNTTPGTPQLLQTRLALSLGTEFAKLLGRPAARPLES